MAERSTRTGDDEDQARYLRGLDDRIAALEREQTDVPVVTETEIPEPCCVCESFSLYSLLGTGWVDCSAPTSHTVTLELGGVEWIDGLPVGDSTGVTLGTEGKWMITAHAEVFFDFGSESFAKMWLSAGSEIWELDAKSTQNATNILLDTRVLELSGSVMINAAATTHLSLVVYGLTTGDSFLVGSAHTSDHATRLQGMLYCAEEGANPLPPPPGS